MLELEGQTILIDYEGRSSNVEKVYNWEEIYKRNFEYDGSPLKYV